MKNSYSSVGRHGSSLVVLGTTLLLGTGLTGGCSKLEVPEIPDLDGGFGDGGPGGGAFGPEDLPGSVTIRGFIKNAQGAPVSAAEITVGDTMSAASDPNGLFDVAAEPSPEDVVLKISAPGHAPQVVLVPIKPDVTNYGVPVVMHRMQTIAIGPDDLSAEVFIGDGSATIEFEEPMGSSATMRFVTMPSESGPGEQRFIDGEPNEALQTAGMLWLELVNEDGDPVPMPGGKVTMNVGSIADIDDAGAWRGFIMNPNDALWSDPQDPVTFDGTTLTFDLPDEGFWGGNRTFTTACVRGVLALDAGSSCGGARVSATGPEGWSSFDSVGADGSFCLMGARSVTSTLHVGEATMSLPMPPFAGNCANPSTCRGIGEVAVPPNGCDLMDVEAPMFAIGSSCTATSQCATGGECFNGYCVGTGDLRVSLAFSIATDLDLHLLTPSGALIFWDTSDEVIEETGGQLDVDQCAPVMPPMPCDASPHAENIVFADSAPEGTYEVWVVNYDGVAGGDFSIEVSGAAEATFEGTIDAEAQAESMRFTFTVGGDAADGG